MGGLNQRDVSPCRRVAIWVIKIGLVPFAVYTDVIESLAAKEKRTYKVSCAGPCSGITAKISSSSGDPDLYGKEDSPPVIRVRDELHRKYKEVTFVAFAGFHLR